VVKVTLGSGEQQAFDTADGAEMDSGSNHVLVFERLGKYRRTVATLPGSSVVRADIYFGDTLLGSIQGGARSRDAG
jgi:hypothetical protein